MPAEQQDRRHGQGGHDDQREDAPSQSATRPRDHASPVPSIPLRDVRDAERTRGGHRAGREENTALDPGPSPPMACSPENERTFTGK